ncbi:MAG: ABC transporter ATP-binding protein [Deltaproteobacteria bacterium]|jgi:ABC-type sugar transport system ATPase subunit|nr:ABC transporter ATP-binding protein [Deltaproteobacteria bacterium]
MSSIRLENVSKSFGATTVLRPLNLEIQSGEFLVLLGPSGCGKSTLLRLIAGLEAPDSGRVFINDRDVTDKDPSARDLAMVFQSYALYPHLTVGENLGFALKNRGDSPAKIQAKVKEVGDLLDLSNLLDRKPKALSGGQRQRVALGRALTRETPVILFDEPLSNLDAHLRTQMRVKIKALHERLKNTMVYVTHDQVEATTMGDRIAVLNRGLIEQLDTPKNIYQSPASEFIARFIGTPETCFFLSKINSRLGYSEKDQLAIRPEHITVGNGEFQGKVLLLENLGAQTLIHIESAFGDVRALKQETGSLKVGEPIQFEINRSKLMRFDELHREVSNV